MSQVQMTPEQMQALIIQLQQQNAELLAKANKPVGGIKVSPKGGVSVYGLGRFPVSLYASQWTALLDRKDEILAFIEANKDKLATKESKEA